jgi:endoglycosylceramidase
VTARRPGRGRRATAAGTVAVVVAALVLEACGGPAVGTLPSLRSPLQPAPTIGGRAPLHGALRAPGGPFLYDSAGRVVILHGVNAVYKYPPYELYPDPGKPWNFDRADASLMARLGFDVVRLGMTWRGLEPGTAPSNDPAICTRGAPGDPGQFDQAVLERYLGHLAQTVNLLGRYHIYTILDMHQDVYNEAFDGEGAPDWAVCTNGLPNVDPPGRWSLGYGTAAAGAAFRHFWTNDVVGDLQGEFDRVWAAVAGYFRGNPWVAGYDPFNEPFSTSLVTVGDEHFDNQLQCFYAGRQFVEPPVKGGPSLPCPAQDPATGVIPTILGADPAHLVFYEPDIYGSHGAPNFVGPMDFPRLVFNVHVYCGYRSPVTGNPTNLAACAAQDARSLATRAEDRPDLASAAQPSGPAWIVGEFGATSDPTLLRDFTDQLDHSLVGWSYWAWKYYGDPTGSEDESLVMARGRLRSTATILSRAYPEAVAGRPTLISSDPATGAFDLAYVANHATRAPTVVFLPTALHYPSGYCARATGARVVSPGGSRLLEVVNSTHAKDVTVSVVPGSCG